MTGDRPALTVVTPAFNAEQWIAGAVRSALAQEGVDVRVVVVDDGSTDGTAGVVRALADARVLLLHQPNAGQGAARNRGLAAAETAYVGFLDADDLLEPGWARAVVTELDRGATVCVTDATVIDSDGDATGSYYDELGFPGDDQPGALLRRNFVLSTAAADRAAVLRAGGFREDQRLRGVEDWALWQDLLLAGGRAVLVPERLCRYRRGHASTSSQVERMKRAEVALLRERLRTLHDPVLRDAAKQGLRALRTDRLLHRATSQAGTTYRRASLPLGRAAVLGRNRPWARTALLLALGHPDGRRRLEDMR